jgi:hypothetical protein
VHYNGKTGFEVTEQEKKTVKIVLIGKNGRQEEALPLNVAVDLARSILSIPGAGGP